MMTTFCAHRVGEAPVGTEAIAAVVGGGGGRGLQGQGAAVAPQAHPGGGRLHSLLLQGGGRKQCSKLESAMIIESSWQRVQQ